MERKNRTFQHTGFGESEEGKKYKAMQLLSEVGIDTNLYGNYTRKRLLQREGEKFGLECIKFDTALRFPGRKVRYAIGDVGLQR